MAVISLLLPTFVLGPALGTLRRLAPPRAEQAAEQNHAEAQYSLGMMYRNGQGIAVDKSRACIRFDLAAAQGHERARDARDSLQSALTPEQLLAAQRAAQQWRPVEAKK